MSFLSVGISHDHAPLDLLERVTIPEEEFGKVLGALLANANIQEAVVVSTDRKSTRLNSSHVKRSRMPPSA